MPSAARFAVALTVTLGCATAGAGPASATTVADGAVARVYVSLPREGKGAPSAALIAKGLKAAVELHGADAGGRRIRLVWLNDARGARWAPDLVVANAERAAADPTAIAYVGEGNSAATALSMPIVNRAGLTHLSPVSTASELTAEATAATYQPTGVQTFYRPFPSDARQSLALLSSVRRAKVADRVVVVDDDGLYGRGLTRGFEESAAGAGVRVLSRHVAGVDGRGVSALARRIATERPTAVVYGGAPSSGAAKVVRALHRAAPKALIFGGDALANAPFARDIGRAQPAVRLTTPAAHVDPRTRAAKALGARPDVFTVFAHNGMTTLLRAVDRAGRTRAGVTRASVRRAVFNGRLQTGLSGHWAISSRGDADYGVYDSLRLAKGRVVTPVDEATDKLVRQELAKLKAKARRSKGRTMVPARTAVRPAFSLATMTPAGLPSTSINMSNIQSMDIEAALMMVQSERTKLLDAQLLAQIQAVQNRNDQVARLNAVLSVLNQLLSPFPQEAKATETATRFPGPPNALGANWTALAAAVKDAGITDLGLPGSVDGLTRSDLDAAIVKVKGMIDAAGNSQQMDMLRLQSMSNKRNEAFDVMTNFVKKMQESRSSIIGNMR
jgi:ABC-type branched-subunit amino acid transport system substrate-binding protein